MLSVPVEEVQRRKEKKFVGRRPQADTLIDDKFTQQMRADGEQKSDRGESGHHLIETERMLRTDALYDGQLSDLPTATFPEACSWSTVPMAIFPEVCSRELSHVNVPKSA